MFSGKKYLFFPKVGGRGGVCNKMGNGWLFNGNFIKWEVISWEKNSSIYVKDFTDLDFFFSLDLLFLFFSIVFIFLLYFF